MHSLEELSFNIAWNLKILIDLLEKQSHYRFIIALEPTFLAQMLMQGYTRERVQIKG